jgi:hypothetical protein
MVSALQRAVQTADEIVVMPVSEAVEGQALQIFTRLASYSR